MLLHDGDFDRAAAELANARLTGHLCRGARWLDADMNLRWGNLSLDLGDRSVAQEHAETARAALDEYPDPGSLPRRLAELYRTDRLPLCSRPHPGRDPDSSLPPDAPLGQGGSRTPPRFARNREDARFLRLREARR